jgi:hypothetical protein
MTAIQKHIDLLGRNVADKVTGFRGVVTSMSFDLYGCIQALVHPGTDADGKIKEQQYFDVNRLLIVDDERVMAVPSFDWTDIAVANGEKGAADKPMSCKA